MLADEEWDHHSDAIAPPSAAPSASAAGPSPPPLHDRAQRAAYDSLSLAIKEGFVFATLTGPAGAGKSTVLEAVLADVPRHTVRCIRIDDPDKVPARLIAQIERVAHDEAGKPENADKHVVLAIEDAHRASNELMRCLTRIAEIRQAGQRIPQVILAGRPELWERLEAEELAPLARRLAIRTVLPTPYTGDGWATVERELSRTQELAPPPLRTPRPLFAPEADLHAMASPRHWAEPLAQPGSEHARAGHAGDVVSPTLYALFPEKASRPTKPARRRSRGTIAVALAGFCVTVDIGAYVWSWYDWPDFLAEPPARQAAVAAAPLPARPAAPQLPAQVAAIPPSKVEAPPAPPAPAEPAAPAVTAQPPMVAAAQQAPTMIARLPAAQPPGNALASIPTAVVVTLLRRGDEAATLGDLSAARLLYQRAAEAGNARAARLAARTYDAAFLASADVTSLADPAAARAWYARAAALGDSEAISRLKSLNGAP